MNCNFKIRRPALSIRPTAFSQRLIRGSWVGVWLLVIPAIVCNEAKAEVEVNLSPLIAKSQVISRTDPAKSISIVLVLPLKDGAGAAEFVRHVSTPKDELFGKFLSPQEFAARFGANEDAYQNAKKWARENGLTISEESVSRTTVTVRGAVGQFEQLFNIQINNYRSPNGEEFYSASAQPTPPKALSSILMSVVGLSGGPSHAPLTKISKTLGENSSGNAADVIFNGGHGPGGGFTAADLRAAYAIPPYLGSAKPQTVAVFEQTGVLPGDIAKYIAYNHLPNVQVTPRFVDGFGGAILYPNEFQAVVDIDLIIGINPAVKEVLVYEDGYPNSLAPLLSVLAAVANDNQAETLDISSFTQESNLTSAQFKAEAQEYTQLAAQGITVVAAAGDGEAVFNNPGFDYVCDPATQPLVTAVGGTALFTSKELLFQSTYLSEEVWNIVMGGVDFTTGGGVSGYWRIPSWQPASVVTPNGGSAKKRNVPDVSAVASPGTPVAVYFGAGGWSLVGGTGVSSAIWTGFISIMNSARETAGLGKIGFFNPSLYNLVSLYGNPGLNDVFYGNNGDPLPPYQWVGYYAGVGYDNCSGWGSMYGTFFAAELLVTPTKNGTPPAAFGGLSGSAKKTTANLTWSKSTGATGYLVLADSPGQGPLFFDYISNKPSIELTGLVPGIIYRTRVIALNTSGATNCDALIWLTPQ